VLLALADVFLTVPHPRAAAGVTPPRLHRAIWWLFRAASRSAGRHRYAAAHRRHAEAGIEVEPEPAAGADRYVELRRQWDGYVRGFAAYMAYDWWRIDPLIGRA
jgi:hypothetical protein